MCLCCLVFTQLRCCLQDGRTCGHFAGGHIAPASRSRITSATTRAKARVWFISNCSKTPEEDAEHAEVEAGTEEVCKIGECMWHQ